MGFLYPTSRQFPFDEVCDTMVRELEKRNWQVPGLTVKFDQYGDWKERYSKVLEIYGSDFRLFFGRTQGKLLGAGWPDTAAVKYLNIPKRELIVDENEGGPSFRLYVGNDWERDREEFVNGSKSNSLLQKKPRIYLRYEGACTCNIDSGNLEYYMLSDRHRHHGQRPSLLTHDNDLGREYDPRPSRWNWRKWRREPAEPKSFDTAEIMEEFKEYLEKFVLKSIISSTIPARKIDERN